MTKTKLVYLECTPSFSLCQNWGYRECRNVGPSAENPELLMVRVVCFTSCQEFCLSNLAFPVHSPSLSPFLFIIILSVLRTMNQMLSVSRSRSPCLCRSLSACLSVSVYAACLSLCLPVSVARCLSVSVYPLQETRGALPG